LPAPAEQREGDQYQRDRAGERRDVAEVPPGDGQAEGGEAQRAQDERKQEQIAPESLAHVRLLQAQPARRPVATSARAKRSRARSTGVKLFSSSTRRDTSRGRRASSRCH